MLNLIHIGFIYGFIMTIVDYDKNNKAIFYPILKCVLGIVNGLTMSLLNFGLSYIIPYNYHIYISGLFISSIILNIYTYYKQNENF